MIVDHGLYWTFCLDRLRPQISSSYKIIQNNMFLLLFACLAEQFQTNVNESKRMIVKWFRV